MSNFHDTIVAPITGTQPAAVASIRISGDRAWEFAAKVFDRLPTDPTARYAYYGRFIHGDDGLLLLFEKGHSFTGEETAECQIHGSPASVRALVSHLIGLGARMAEPGEFTYRAFMTGRMDLSQAEGVRETVDSQTARQLQQANMMRQGVLREAVSQAREALFGVLAMVEATVDFSEEIGELDRDEAIRRLPIGQLEDLAATAQQGLLTRQGIAVAIVGPPNAGKSSLLNRLLGADRAIVTPVAGTTRDTIEESAEINGLLVRFIDTAGLRAATDEAEKLGIERSTEAALGADRTWFVYDASIGWGEAEQSEWERLMKPQTIVANKCDLARKSNQDHFAVSALTGEGISSLTNTLLTLEQAEAAVTINGRHAPLVQRALSSARAAKDVFESPVPDDLAAVHLRDALHALGEITGDTASEDMIDRIFRDFCIGK
ncbi:MAG: tRNA uridine-5-carboxymethylaminomethyl(34) synthesis GTPase MnmE [Chthonomonas sp.]|nr:tRNA uridine-5-carboxymethylaminomethyl(34) synthesis GTPase MnmE [Chthonomonas sp.]